ncbi:MAG: endolytic transglycosylase MltG [Bacteroides sp.]|nr:endolytic transglycosylase MltG [Ruminococcus flavefaciens]MCM1554220.1 endolytic transglycosylase MltG [Bacteroides sp.]
MAKKKKFSKKLKYGLYAIAVCIFALMVAVASVGLGSAVKHRTELYIPSGATYAQVQDSLRASGNISMFNFEIISRIKDYPRYVKPGRYVLQRGSTAKAAVNKLRMGFQDQIRLTLRKFRTPEALAGHVSRQIEADSASIAQLLLNDEYLSGYWFPAREYETLDEAFDTLPVTTQTVLCLFIPDTYYCFWNMDAQGFLARMYYEQNRFWNDFRRGQARAMGLNRVQVSTLASIVEEETLNKEERPDVASVYLNRYRKRMPLQADPTVKFAIGDFAMKRILKEHLKYESPYNTYLRYGLPPGPICTPSVSSLDAVLQNKPTKYLYFCAKADFSGTHSFAESYSQHLANARAYQRELNKKGIKK